MKSLFTAIAILLSVATFAQNIVFETNKKFPPLFENQIVIGSKENPSVVNSYKYSFTLNGQTQTIRKSDTLQIIDKQIRFIVVDGVTYEIVRTTEVKKAVAPDTINYGFPFPLRTGNPVTLLPNYFRSN